MTQQTDEPMQHADPPAQAETRLREVVKDRKRSALGKYQEVAVGRRGVAALVMYELWLGVLGPMPGAVGIWLRQKLYRFLLGRCGRGVAIGRNVTIRHPHRVALGDNVIVDDNAVLDGKGDDATTLSIGDDTMIGRNTIVSCKGGRIDIGRGVNVSVNCTLLSETRLDIGEKVLVAGHCYVIAGGNHGLEQVDVPIVEQPLRQLGGVRIEHHSWVGAGVIVLDGVRVGHDAVLGAGSVATRSIPAYAVATGAPAQQRRDRREARDDA